MRPSATAAPLKLRPAAQVMTLARMGCFHQTRLSFMRTLLRNLKRDNWSFARHLWQVDAHGVGVAVYRATGPQRTYSLVCFSHDLPPTMRSDRVIATAWDATFTLFDGIPEAQDIARLQRHVPRQEAGHCTQQELVLARANRSVRLFEHVLAALAGGRQPDPEMLDRVGYLMRTTAVYGNGKFGISDRGRIAERPEFAAAFHVELLAVWLIRWFTVDIVQHLARVQGGDKAVNLDPELRRRLGVGNSTGLGMAPFLILHPILIHRWIEARETALATVRSIPQASAQATAYFCQLVARMRRAVASWHTDNPRQTARLVALRRDLSALEQYPAQPGLEADYPWDKLINWSERTLSPEGQELVVSLAIEPYGALVDELAETMAADESFGFIIDGAMPVGELLALIEQHYAWALAIDYTAREASARFWYYSEEKLEPRVGERYEEPGADREHPLAYGRDIKCLQQALVGDGWKPDTALATFLVQCPEHRHSVRRVQLAARFAYAEIRDNLLAAEMMPVDLLRCKLSFFGANRFDPRSDRWIRINMYQHAPYPDEIHQTYRDDWVYPPL